MKILRFEYSRELSVVVIKYKEQLSKSVARGAVKIPPAPFPPVVIFLSRRGVNLNAKLQHKITLWNKYIGYSC